VSEAREYSRMRSPKIGDTEVRLLRRGFFVEVVTLQGGCRLYMPLVPQWGERLLYMVEKQLNGCAPDLTRSDAEG